MKLREYLEMVLPVTNLLFVTQDNVCEYVDISNVVLPKKIKDETLRIDFNNKYCYFELDQKIKKNNEDIIVKGYIDQFELKQFTITFLQFTPIIVNI